MSRPQHLIDQFNGTIQNVHRRTFAGMVAALDIGVGKVVATLKETGLYANTLIVFTTDNGGPVQPFDDTLSSSLAHHSIYVVKCRTPAGPAC